MKKITTFEDLKVFQFAAELMVEVYRVTETYPKRELYGLVSQMSGLIRYVQRRETQVKSRPKSSGNMQHATRN